MEVKTENKKKISIFSTSFLFIAKIHYIPPIPCFCTQTNQKYLCISIRKEKISRFFSTSFFLLLRYIPPIPSFCTQTNQIYLCISNFASLPKFCLYPGPIKRTEKATYYKSSNWFCFVLCFRMRLNMFSYCSLFSINIFFYPTLSAIL